MVRPSHASSVLHLLATGTPREVAAEIGQLSDRHIARAEHDDVVIERRAASSSHLTLSRRAGEWYAGSVHLEPSAAFAFILLFIES